MSIILNIRPRIALAGHGLSGSLYLVAVGDPYRLAHIFPIKGLILCVNPLTLKADVAVDSDRLTA